MARKQEKKDRQNGFGFFPQPNLPPADENSPALSITVVFTTPAATLMALRHAVAWVHQLGMRLRIIVPEVVPYPLPIDRPCVPPEFRVQPVRAWCEQEGIEALIEIRLCRNICECLKQGLAPSSLILLGVRKNWWPFTSEARLTRTLQQAGHQVLAVRHRSNARL